MTGLSSTASMSVGAEGERRQDLVAAGRADDQLVVGRLAEHVEGDRPRVGRRSRSRASASPSKRRMPEPNVPSWASRQSPSSAPTASDVDAEHRAPVGERRASAPSSFVVLDPDVGQRRRRRRRRRRRARRRRRPPTRGERDVRGAMVSTPTTAKTSAARATTARRARAGDERDGDEAAERRRRRGRRSTAGRRRRRPGRAAPTTMTPRAMNVANSTKQMTPSAPRFRNDDAGAVVPDGDRVDRACRAIDEVADGDAHRADDRAHGDDRGRSSTAAAAPTPPRGPAASRCRAGRAR